MLGGGGFTGGVYEIGALRALDLLAVNRTVNEFDVYVGTSAGSFVAALAANGVTPEEMMRVVNQQVPTPFRDVDLSTLMRPNTLEFAQSAALLPLRLVGLARNVAGQPACDVSVMDLAVGLAEGLPAGIYDGQRHRGVPRGRARRPRPHATTSACSSSELYLTATDLDTCERDRVRRRRTGTTCRSPTAVAASTALPMVYKPVEMKGRHLVDGGMRSTTNVDVAVERGAKFIVVVNPLVPYVNDFQKVIPTMLGSRVRRVARHGLPADRLPGVQAARPPAPARGGQALAGEVPGRGHHPDRARPERRADVRDEHHELHQRVEIARHGFESVTIKLAKDYDSFKAICAKHGIEISATPRPPA